MKAIRTRLMLIALCVSAFSALAGFPASSNNKAPANPQESVSVHLTLQSYQCNR